MMEQLRFATSRLLTAVAFLAVLCAMFLEHKRAGVAIERAAQAEQQLRRQTIAAERSSMRIGGLGSKGEECEATWRAERALLLRHLLRGAEDPRGVILGIVEADYELSVRQRRPLAEEYDVTFTLQEGGWHVDCELKRGDGDVVAGGGPHYVVDSESGEIISKKYEQ